MDKSKIKRILVITLSNIGDIILTTPAIEALLSEFPGARLDVMVGPSGKDLFSAHGKISSCVIYDKKSSPLRKIKLFVKLLKKRYDLVVDLRNTVLPVLLLPRFKTSPLQHRKKGESLHKSRVHLSRLKEIGINISGASFYIPVGESDRKYVDSLLGVLEGKPFVVLSPSAKSHLKRWPLKNFATLSDMIKNELGYEVVFIGDKYDRVVTERILFYMETKPLNLLEKTNIRQLAYLIKKSRLLITNDSAPLHVGGAVGANILAFFGPTDEKKYGPITEAKSRVLKRNIKCAPCEAPQCINLANKYECLKTITAEEAFKAMKEILKECEYC